MSKRFIINNFFEDSVLITYYLNYVQQNLIVCKIFIDFALFFSDKRFFFANFKFHSYKAISLLKKTGLKKFQGITKIFEVLIFSKIFYGKLSKNTIKNFIILTKINKKCNLTKEIDIFMYFNFFIKNIIISEKLWDRKNIYEIVKKILNFEITGTELKFFYVFFGIFLKTINKKKKCLYFFESLFLRISFYQKINSKGKFSSQIVLPGKIFSSLFDRMSEKKTQIRCLIIVNTNILKNSLRTHRFKSNKDLVCLLKNKIPFLKKKIFSITSVFRKIFINLLQNNHFRFIRRLETLKLNIVWGIKNQNIFYFSLKLHILKQLNIWTLKIFLKSIYFLDFLFFKKIHADILFKNQENLSLNSINLSNFLIKISNKNITFLINSFLLLIVRNSSKKIKKKSLFVPDQKNFVILRFVYSFCLLIMRTKKNIYLKYGGKENILKKLIYSKDLFKRFPHNFSITVVKRKESDVNSKFWKNFFIIKQKNKLENILKHAYYLLENLKKIFFCTHLFPSFVEGNQKTIVFLFIYTINDVLWGEEKRLNTNHLKKNFRCFSIFLKIYVFLKNLFLLLQYTKNNLKIIKTSYLYLKKMLNFFDKDFSFLFQKKIINMWINDFFFKKEFALQKLTGIWTNIKYKNLFFKFFHKKKKLTDLRKSFLLKKFRKISKK
jgi:hypothetical protein